MPCGWLGVQRSAYDWVAFALYDRIGRPDAMSLAGVLLEIAERSGITVEELVNWIYEAPSVTTLAFRRAAELTVAARGQGAS